MSNTLIQPIKGEKKYKLAGLTKDEQNVLKDNRNNIYKALTILGGSYLAYETYQNLSGMSKEEWEQLLPDELEKFLSSLFKEHIDIEKSLEEEDSFQTPNHNPETEETTISPDEENNDQEHRSDETVIIHDEKDNTPEAIEIEKNDIIDTLEEEGYDENIISDVTIDDENITLDEEMTNYINSDEIIEDLNDDDAEEIIINDDYINYDEIDNDANDDYIEEYDDDNDYIEEDYSDDEDLYDIDDESINIDDLPDNL